MSEIDVTKCRFYLDDGSCCSHDTDCTKCIHCYCDWKVHQEQLHRYKQVIEEIKKIAEQQVPYINLDQVKTCTEVEYDYAGKIWNLEQRMYNILQKISENEEAKNENRKRD